MFSTQMQRIYKRWLILGLLSMCLVVFGFSDMTTPASGAICFQVCQDNWNQCNDSCIDDCGDAASSDTSCSDCLTTCEDTFFNCASRSVHCGNSPAYNPQCQVEFGQHCPPDANGNPDCGHPDAHNGYYEICNVSFGFQCVACPGNEICYTAGIPPCF